MLKKKLNNNTKTSLVSYNNLNYYIYLYFTLKNLEFLFFKKQIYITHYCLNLFKNKIKIILDILVFSRKFLKLKLKLKKFNRWKKKAKLSKKNLIHSFNKLINKLMLKNKNFNGLFLSINLLNVIKRKEKRKIKNKQKRIFLFLKTFSNNIFPRRFNLLIDFSKVCIYFLNKKISNQFFIKMLSGIFSFLPKQKHKQFFLFLNKLFSFFFRFFKRTNTLLGLKLRINGKLLGKSRSSGHLLIVGNVPIKKTSTFLEYAKSTSFTKYGTFGFFLWSLRK